MLVPCASLYSGVQTSNTLSSMKIDSGQWGVWYLPRASAYYRADIITELLHTEALCRLFAIVFGHERHSPRGLLQFDLIVSIRVVFCRRRHVVFSLKFLKRKKQGRRCYWVVGFYVKTVCE